MCKKKKKRKKERKKEMGEKIPKEFLPLKQRA